MPIYEYMCEATGEIFEWIRPISESEIKRQTCPVHFVENHKEGKDYHDVIRIWSLPGNIQIGKPTRMFINNKTGEPFSPISQYDKPPKGYHEIELRSPTERSKFEREQQRRIDGQNQFTSHMLDSMKSEARNKRHDDLKARMNAVQKEEFTNKEGKTETVEFTLDHKDKALLEKAMKRSRKKPMKEKKSDVMLAVNHYNPSNMDEVK